MGKPSARQRRRDLERQPINIDELVNSESTNGLVPVQTVFRNRMLGLDNRPLIEQFGLEEYVKRFSQPTSLPSSPAESSRVEESESSTVVDSDASWVEPSMSSRVEETPLDSNVLKRKGVQSAVLDITDFASRRARVEDTESSRVEEKAVIESSRVEETESSSPEETVSSRVEETPFTLVSPEVPQEPAEEESVKTEGILVSSNPKSIYLSGQVRVYRLGRYQECLTSKEETLYDMLWNGRTKHGDKVGQLVGQRENLKHVQVGYDELANPGRKRDPDGGKKGWVSDRSIRNLIPKLIEKGFVRILELSTPKKPMVYEVFGYAALKQKFQDEGWVGYVKHGPAKDLVRPKDMPRPVSSRVEDTESSRAAVSSTGRVEATSTLRVEDSGAGPYESYSLDHSSRNNDDDVRALYRRVLTISSAVDRGVVREVWAQSRREVPDCTVDEVFSRLQEAIPVLFKRERDKQVKSATGVLCQRWDDWFSKDWVELQRENARTEREANEAIYRSWLESADSSEDMKQQARIALGIATKGAGK
jgi:YD repeat-containing protein